MCMSHPQSAEVSGGEAGEPIVLRARNRLAVAEGKNGSIAFFPPPHQFFFARELEVNLGYVWFRKDDEKTFSVGIRQGESAEGYNPVWIEKVFSLYNAPPGTWQRMPVYFYVSPDDGTACRDSVMAFTHGDRFKPLPGYKTMVTHFHTAFTQELMDSGSLDTTPPWIPLMRAMGINIAHIFDFHGDGHPHDPGPLRLKELENYFEACRRHSDGDFLILPGEEANAYLGGHYNILFPKPVYWTLVRGKDQPLVKDDPKYGKVYHTGSAEDVFELMKREDALVWTTHPRTKGSTGYPDKIRDTDYFRERTLAGRGLQGNAGGPVAEAPRRGAVLRHARRHEQLGRSQIHGRRGGHVQEVPRLRPLRRLQRELREARSGAELRRLEPCLPCPAMPGSSS